MSNGLYSGQSGLSLGIGLYQYVSGLWSGANGFLTGAYGQTLSLNFLAGAPLDPRITFTRASTATFVGSNGLIQTAAIDTPRFDYNPTTLAPKGLLIEEQRTNLLLYSAQFDNAAWTKSNSTVTVDATVSPDGTSNADKIVEAATTSIHDVRRNSTASASTAYTQSIFVKAAERTKIQLQMFGNTGGSTVNFDLVAGTVNVAGAYGGWSSSSGTITSFGNGWYRLTNTSTTNVGLTVVTSAFLLADAAGNASYTGNGTSGMFYFGAQLEAGAFATSYVPTVAAQVTRAVDIATMTGTNFSSWCNQSAGTMLCSFALEGVDTSAGAAGVWKIDDTTNNNVIFVRQGTVIAGFDGNIITAGVSEADSDSFSATPNTIYNSAFAWETNYAVLASNGTVLGPDTVVNVPTTTRLVIHGVAGCMWTRSLTYYPSRLPNTTLQALTS